MMMGFLKRTVKKPPISGTLKDIDYKEAISAAQKDNIVRDYFAENRDKALSGVEDGLRLEEMAAVKKFAEWLEKKHNQALHLTSHTGTIKKITEWLEKRRIVAKEKEIGIHGEKFEPCKKFHCLYYEEWEILDQMPERSNIPVQLKFINCLCCIHFKGTDRFRRKEQEE